MNLVRFRADGFEMSTPVVGHMSPAACVTSSARASRGVHPNGVVDKT